MFTQTKSWRKFKRKAAFYQRQRWEIADLLEHGERPERIQRRLTDKYGNRSIGGAAGLTSLTTTIGSTFSWQAGLTPGAGVNYSNSTNPGSITKKLSIGTGAANAAIGGSDEVFSFQQGITAGSAVTLNLITMTDLLQRASSAIVRIKGYQIRLLSTLDDSTISPVPTLTSTATVTNLGPANPAALDFGGNAGASGFTVALTGSGAVTAVAVGAGGTGYPASTTFPCSPVQNSGSGCIFLATTNSSGVVTSVQFITATGGAGYSAATVPAVMVGLYTLYTGGFHPYSDPSPAGFCLVSATQKNIIIQNNDAVHAVTMEIDVIGGST